MSDPAPPFVLDTCALTDLTKPRSPRYKEARAAFAALIQSMESRGLDSHDFLSLSAVTLFESLGGLYNNGATAQVDRLREFIDAYLDILEFTDETAEHAGQLYAVHPRHNDNCDLMILAVAIEEGGTLITADGPLTRFAERTRSSLGIKHSLACGWDAVFAAAAEE